MRPALALILASPTPLVVVRERVLDGLIAHDDPAPAGEIGASGRLLSDVDTLEKEFVVDWT